MPPDKKRAYLTVALPPRNLNDIKNSIEGKLNGLVSHYVPEVNGILTGWNDLNVLNDNGIIIDDQPYVFFKVSFRADVFQPIEGKLVIGRVQQLLKSYFIVKVKESFTVTVTIPESLASHHIVTSMTLNQEVYLRIKGSSEGVYRGELDDECLDLTNSQIIGRVENDDYEYAESFEY